MQGGAEAMRGEASMLYKYTVKKEIKIDASFCGGPPGPPAWLSTRFGDNPWDSPPNKAEKALFINRLTTPPAICPQVLRGAEILLPERRNRGANPVIGRIPDIDQAPRRGDSRLSTPFVENPWD